METEKTNRKFYSILIFIGVIILLLSSNLVYFLFFMDRSTNTSEDNYLLISVKITGIYAYNNTPVQNRNPYAYSSLLQPTEKGFFAKLWLKPLYSVYTNSFHIWVNGTVAYMNCTVFENNDSLYFVEQENNNSLDFDYEHSFQDLILFIFVDFAVEQKQENKSGGMGL